MPKNKMTPEERKAWGAKMKALREKKALERDPQFKLTPQTIDEPVPPAQPSPSAPETISQGDDIEQMKRQIAELTQLILSRQSAPQITPKGVVGTLEKFPVDPIYYPTKEQIFERLLGEERLSIQGFNRIWWDINYEVSSVSYDTKDGLNVTEPKFRVELIRILPDPDTQQPSNQRYVLHKLTMFEDPQAAIQVARQYGLEVREEDQKQFLDDMRYLRIRDWVAESFYPPKPTQVKSNKKETVIANRLVDVYEINSTQSEVMPFNQITKKG